MKSAVIKFILIVLTFSLVACSTNTQKENTGIGAVSGAVVGGVGTALVGGHAAAIGVGAVIGALVGGIIGHSMDSSDTQHTATALNNPTNKPTSWKNKKTGHTYTVVPVSGPITINGNHDCRKFRTTAIINGKKERFYGYACRQPNGSWETVSR